VKELEAVSGIRF